MNIKFSVFISMLLISLLVSCTYENTIERVVVETAETDACEDSTESEVYEDSVVIYSFSVILQEDNSMKYDYPDGGGVASHDEQIVVWLDGPREIYFNACPHNGGHAIYVQEINEQPLVFGLLIGCVIVISIGVFWYFQYRDPQSLLIFNQ